MSHRKGEEFTSEWAFVAHGCKVSDFSALQNVPWFDLNCIQPSSKIPGLMFVRPIESWANHLIWGGTFSFGIHAVGGRMLEEHLNATFVGTDQSILLTTLDPTSRLTIVAGSFTAQLAVEFLRWSGYQQEVLIVDAKGRRLMFLNDSSEYLVYSRDRALHRNPFEGVTDQDLANDFSVDLADFGPEKIDATLFDHIETELIDLCEEHGRWMQLTRRSGES